MEIECLQEKHAFPSHSLPDIQRVHEKEIKGKDVQCSQHIDIAGENGLALRSKAGQGWSSANRSKEIKKKKERTDKLCTNMV